MRKDHPRSAAKRLGLKTYETGKPCKHGHIASRVTHTGLCTQCKAEKLIPSQHKYREYSAAWRKKYPGRDQEVKYRHRYGVELSLVRPKPDRCEICEMPHKKIVFDHCHQSGAFRGWLCDPCNIALGIVRDDPAILAKMIAYLNANSSKDLGLLADGVEKGPVGQSEGQVKRKAIC